MTFKILIADDEPLARERIRQLLEHEEGVLVVAEAANGVEAARAIRAASPDLVFLDVQMPEMDGFGVVEEIGPDRMPAVVFVTAYDRYALRAFEVHALDYLLKPFDASRFRSALAVARARRKTEERGEMERRLLSLLRDRPPGGDYAERIAVRDAGKILFLRVEEVDWIGAAGNYVELHVRDQVILHRETMASLEARLDPRKFLRVHRSTIVGADRVREILPWFRGDHQLVLKDGTKLTLSRTYRERVLSALGRSR